MLFVELQSVDQTQQLVHVAAQWQVVDDLRTDNTVGVDQEGTTEGHAAFGLDVVGLADFVGHVGSQGVLHLTDAAVVDRGVTPGVVGEVRVDRHADHFHVARLEVRDAVVQGDQLGRADEGEVQRVEEHQAVLALDGRSQVEAVDDLAIAQHGRNGEIGGFLTNEYAHCNLLMRVKNRLPGQTGLPDIQQRPTIIHGFW
ncbi:hypothetical protein D3C72_1142970 [compost metagenome]